MEPVLGIDVSQYNWPRGIPLRTLPKLHRAGVRFAISRASIGLKADPTFSRNRQRTESRGWVPGAYHYLQEHIGGSRQAIYYIARLRATGGVEGVLKALDVEDDRVGIKNLVTLNQIRDFVETFHARYPRQQLIVYTNRSTWGRLGNPDISDLGFDGAWQALYGVVFRDEPLPARPPTGFGGEGRIPLWQWGRLRVPSPRKGDPKHAIIVDGNAWYGTLDDLRELSIRERTPAQDRKIWVDAFNAEIQALSRSISLMLPPAGTPVQIAGARAALEAAEEAVLALTIGGFSHE